jgi:hypothetical protein
MGNGAEQSEAFDHHAADHRIERPPHQARESDSDRFEARRPCHHDHEC